MAGSGSELSRRELAVVCLGAALIAIVMHWPLILNLGEDIPKDLGDPLAQAWQVAWGGYALAHQPLEFFQANQFWPLPDTLAFSDALIGYAPAGLLGAGPEAAVARYDLLFLFAYALALAGAYVLARELGLGRGPAAVAGAAFAFAPFRLEQDGHLHVISSGGIPLALALGLRGYRRAVPGWVLAGGAVAAWQLSLGFTLGLPLGYLLALLAAGAGVLWLRRGRPTLDRRLVAATVASAALFAGVALVLAQPYLRVAEAHPEAERSPAVVEEFSGPPWIFLVAPEESLVWGRATAPFRDGLSNVPEKTLFPGLAILALAVLGAVRSPLSRRLRLGLAAAAAAISVLALGFQEEHGILWPYRVVYELLPGWEGLRVPGRLVTFSSLALALLAAGGAQTAIGTLRRRRPGWRALPAGAAAALVLAICVEGAGLPFDPLDRRAQPRAPDPPTALAAIEAPQLHLPALRATDNRRYLLWSTDGLPDMVNGRSSIDPAFTAELIDSVRGFPDRESVALLRAVGVRSVVLYPGRAPGTPWAGAASRPLAGLPVRRRRSGRTIVYELSAARADLGSTTRSGSPARRRR